MTATSNKGTFQPDSDVHITYEDQQRINRFARLNAKLDDYKEEIKIKENDLKSLEEACDEIALFDEDEQIPYLVGEVFIYQNTETTQDCLEEAKKRIEKEIKELKGKSNEVRDIMGELKSHLYGRFGSHINLEADEE
ncbi:probable prefoldin subunit 4 isoform X2 [Anoplophora glabripennis]|uniref:probable prefoldin subunit 4 isoform X2 n=1 Tax=Anoplophora glabripennis TaxID=217634 RepID=UPI0008742A2D|nr:probable prefoldin subunit 4 isoform X2 [Anoplophora glabripennis]